MKKFGTGDKTVSIDDENVLTFDTGTKSGSAKLEGVVSDDETGFFTGNGNTDDSTLCTVTITANYGSLSLSFGDGSTDSIAGPVE